MKYRIEIWIYGRQYDAYESDTIQEILKWWIDNWFVTYDNGLCAFCVYKDNEEIGFHELYTLGFV